MSDLLPKLALKSADPEKAISVFQMLEPELQGTQAIQDPLKVSALLHLLGNSPFLARWALKHPSLVAGLWESPSNIAYNFNSFIELFENNHKNYLNLDKVALSSALIQFKYNNLFRISLAEFGKWKPFPKVVEEWSELARAIVEIALRWHRVQANREWGELLLSSGETLDEGYCVMALGKLGGRELNFSSDIDLQYFYASDEGRVLRDGIETEMSPQQYFNQLSERLTNFLSQKTSEGFLYRVDLELRPEGRAGVLANSLSSLESYYESFGADWEKQALLKAAWAAGDSALFEEFLRRMQPFIYPKIRDFSFLDSMKKMKGKIMASLKKEAFHLKLGDGGIREIEFFVQSFQFLFGGRTPAIRTPNTLEALDRLQMAGLIPKEEEIELQEAYIYLRTMEHRLQLVEEQQVHTLPTSPEELEQLARRMGYAEDDITQARRNMESDLDRHCSFVKRSFREIFSHKLKE